MTEPGNPVRKTNIKRERIQRNATDVPFDYSKSTKRWTYIQVHSGVRVHLFGPRVCVFSACDWFLCGVNRMLKCF